MTTVGLASLLTVAQMREREFEIFRAPEGRDPALGAEAARWDSMDRGTGAALYEFQVERPATAARSNPSPAFPNALWATKVTGRVTATFVVDTRGHIDLRTFKVLESDHELFSAEVRKVLPSLRFVPARVADHFVPQWVQQTFEFRAP